LLFECHSRQLCYLVYRQPLTDSSVPVFGHALSVDDYGRSNSIIRIDRGSIVFETGAWEECYRHELILGLSFDFPLIAQLSPIRISANNVGCDYAIRIEVHDATAAESLPIRHAMVKHLDKFGVRTSAYKRDARYSWE
jgi:hypothetical protein